MARFPRQWTVLHSLRHGFGSSQMVSLLFEIFQIWKEQHFATPYIRFHSLSELIRRVQLQKTATAYHRLRHDLSALVEDFDYRQKCLLGQCGWRLCRR